MSKILKDFFIKHGERIHAPGDEPILLNEKYVWYITEGDIDIFSLKFKSGKPAGARYQLFRVGEGELIFPLEHQSVQNEGFIGIGTFDTYLYRVDFNIFNKLIADSVLNKETAVAVDSWIRKTADVLSYKNKPLELIDISEKVKEQDVLKTGVSITGSKSVIWIEVDDSFTFLDSIKSTVHGRFPFTEGLWGSCGKEVDLLEIYSTEMCVEERLFLDYLLAFNTFFCVAVLMKKTEEAALEKLSLENRNSEDERTLSSSLHKFADIFSSAGKRDIFSNCNEDNLLSAMNIIGKYEDLKFSSHPSMSAEDSIEKKIRMISDASNIRYRKIVLKNKWYKGDSGAIMGFEEKGTSPVAIVPVSTGKYMVCSPEKKAALHVDDKVADTLLPFGYVFYRPLPNKKLTWKDIYRYSMRGNTKTVVWIIILSLIGAALGLVSPLATGVIFDTIIPEAAKSQLLQIAIIIFTCSITLSFLSLTKSIATQRFSSKAGYKLQAAVWDRLLSLPVGFFKEYTAGDLAQRSMGINHIRNMMNNVVISTLTNSIFSIGYLFLLFYYSVSLAFVGLSISLVLIFITLGMSYITIRYQKQLIRLEGEISGVVLQFITGISKLRVNGAENRAFFQWADKFASQKRLAMKSGIVENIGGVINSFFPLAASMIIFAWVIFKLSKGSLSAGQYMAFNSAYLSLQSALMGMSSTVLTIISIIPIYKRIKPIMTELPEVSSNKPLPGKLSGKIEVNNVSFKYAPKEPEVLKDITFDIKKGEFVAVVGASGSGKSTLMRLLLGFEKPENGTIYYDNNDISYIDIRDLRRQIGVVLQNSTLMQGSIYENIVGASGLSIEHAWEAADMAGCSDDIKEMPMQMHTVINTGGGTISGGQKQRIMIARALVKKPEILFFDEATSALDNKTQAIVSRTVEKLNVTRVVIAHRLSTIINADKIIVLDKGQIIQQGTYEELMKDESGTFAKLAQRQMV